MSPAKQGACGRVPDMVVLMQKVSGESFAGPSFSRNSAAAAPESTSPNHSRHRSPLEDILRYTCSSADMGRWWHRIRSLLRPQNVVDASRQAPMSPHLTVLWHEVTSDFLQYTYFGNLEAEYRAH
jgi:hypothetical protein